MCALCRAAAPTVRASARTLRQSPRQIRTLYTDKPHVAHSVRGLSFPLPSSTDTYLPSPQNFPFSYANKKSFALKYTGTLTTFFLVPFIACGYQL